jgi:hypothetical protein
LALLALWIIVLSLPMLAGEWLAGPFSDEFKAGYSYRHWSAEYIRANGAIPLWNPMIFGGLPYLGAMHGDIFYWTSWLRLVLPTEVVMNLGFVVHYIGAGMLTYAFLRMLGLGWTAAVTGGMAYELSGLVASYPAPGHDGKLFVTALLPLALIALVLAVRRGRLVGYPLLALAVGLAVVSPHHQALYYMLIASGLFALYLAFGAADRPAFRVGALRAAGAFGAVVLGFGIGMVQVLPFLAYLPYSPRAETFGGGFAAATTYGIPWAHVPEFALARFVGTSEAQTYWGTNGIKFHSEYLGLPVVALAALGAAAPERRRLVWWLSGIGLLFLLVSLGRSTPFYQLWWSVMPFMRQVRAPGIAFYIVAFVVAVLAAFGAERLLVGQGRRHAIVWLAVGAAVVALGGAGVFGAMARAIALTQQGGGAWSAGIADRAGPAIRGGAMLSGAALLVVAALATLAIRGKLRPALFAVLLPLSIGADLWSNGRPFWMYSRVSDLFAVDSVRTYLGEVPRPTRVLDLQVYQQGGLTRNAVLMADGIPQLFGHHGNELDAFDRLLGLADPDPAQRVALVRALSPRIWDLYAISHVIAPASAPVVEQVPGFAAEFDTVMTNVATPLGIPANVFRRKQDPPYARVVPGAVAVPDESAIPVIVDPRSRFDPTRIVLLDPSGPITPAPLDTMPARSVSRAVVDQWKPGAITVHFAPSPPADGYLVVSENWYPDWRATVDGTPAPTIRGDVALLTVPIPAGARSVQLVFRSGAYTAGRAISLASVLLVLAAFAVAQPLERRRRG